MWSILLAVSSVVDPEGFFPDLYPDTDLTFQLVLDPTCIFSNILNINFTFAYPSCKCMLHIMTRYKLFRNFLKTGM